MELKRASDARLDGVSVRRIVGKNQTESLKNQTETKPVSIMSERRLRRDAIPSQARIGPSPSRWLARLKHVDKFRIETGLRRA